MGKADEYQPDYLDDNFRFADQIDGALFRGRLLHILVVENQTYVNYRMVLRNMLTESLSYHKQWKHKKVVHDSGGELSSDRDAFLSGMGSGERFIPIITLVVYCGTEHPWDGARCLYDLLDIDDEMKKYVANYRLNLYDCHEHDTFDEYLSGLRQLFEVVRYSKEEEAGDMESGEIGKCNN